MPAPAAVTASGVATPAVPTDASSSAATVPPTITPSTRMMRGGGVTAPAVRTRGPDVKGRGSAPHAGGQPPGLARAVLNPEHEGGRDDQDGDGDGIHGRRLAVWRRADNACGADLDARHGAAFRSLTPAPPPFSGMNSTPAASKTKLSLG